MAEFRDTDTSLSLAFTHTANAIQSESITLRELLELIGEQGLLLFCSVLTLPFLLPVSIPGVSTVFGLVIILIGIGVTLNRVPWLPNRLMKHKIQREHLIPALESGAKTFTRVERWLKRRLDPMTGSTTMNRFNGFLLTFSGILLIFPFGLIPLSNTLPALAILLLAIGMLERDGYFIIAGYLTIVVSLLYFSGLAMIAILGGQTFLS